MGSNPPPGPLLSIWVITALNQACFQWLSDKTSSTALDKQIEAKVFDEMLFDIPRLYISQVTLSYDVQPVRLYPILLMSILLFCYE